MCMNASVFGAKPDKQKVELFLHVARMQAIQMFYSFVLNAKEKGNYDVVIGKFNSFCNPKTNETYERYVIHRRNQC